MKTKLLIILSTCLFLFSCGDKRTPEKKAEQKPEVVTKNSNVADKKKKKTFATEKKETQYSAANSEHVSIMASAQKERMKLAEMLPDDIREKIATMVADRDVKGLTKMCNQLSRIGDYNNAFLIASNFLAHAETETEKQMAASFYANLATEAFIRQNRNLNNDNKNKLKNIKKLLVRSIKDTPDNPNIDQSILMAQSLVYYSCISAYEMDLDSMYNIYDLSYNKISKLSDNRRYNNYDHIFMQAYKPLQRSKNYEKVKISDENLNRMLDYTDKIISGERPFQQKKKSYYIRFRNVIQKFKDYRLNNNNKF